MVTPPRHLIPPPVYGGGGVFVQSFVVLYPQRKYFQNNLTQGADPGIEVRDSATLSEGEGLRGALWPHYGPSWGARRLSLRKLLNFRDSTGLKTCVRRNNFYYILVIVKGEKLIK
jgi:hypothetical protein